MCIRDRLHYPGAGDTKTYLEQEYQQQQAMMQQQMAMQQQQMQMQAVQDTVSRAREDAARDAQASATAQSQQRAL